MLEIMVAIIISGIVIATAYSVYLYMNSMFIKFSSSKKEMKTYFELTTIINKEFSTAKYVEMKNSRELNMVFTDKVIVYVFNDENVLRTFNQHTDTFEVKINDVVYNNLHQQNKTWVDYLEISIQQKDKSEVLSFIKDYGAISKVEEVKE